MIPGVPGQRQIGGTNPAMRAIIPIAIVLVLTGCTLYPR
jgi:hypothetical protein